MSNENSDIREGKIDFNGHKKEKKRKKKIKAITISIVIVMIMLVASAVLLSKKGDSDSPISEDLKKFQAQVEETKKEKEKNFNSIKDQEIDPSKPAANDSVETMAKSALDYIKTKAEKLNEANPSAENSIKEENQSPSSAQKGLVESVNTAQEIEKAEYSRQSSESYEQDSVGESSMIVFSRGNRFTDHTSKKEVSREYEEEDDNIGSKLSRMLSKKKMQKKSSVSEDEKESAQSIIYNDLPPARIFEGDFLEGVLQNKLICDKEEAPLMVGISRNFYDVNNKWILIPTGTRFIGKSQVVSYMGADRLFTYFHRAILPNGESIYFSGDNRMMGLDQEGSFGLKTRVNRHFGMKFGTSILFGLLDGLAGLGQSKLAAGSPLSFMLSDTGNNFREVNREIFKEYSMIVPTITVKAGHRIKIYMNSDVIISPYAAVDERMRR